VDEDELEEKKASQLPSQRVRELSEAVPTRMAIRQKFNEMNKLDLLGEDVIDRINKAIDKGKLDLLSLDEVCVNTTKLLVRASLEMVRSCNLKTNVETQRTLHRLGFHEEKKRVTSKSEGLSIEKRRREKENSKAHSNKGGD
jgi:hypothetical protein